MSIQSARDFLARLVSDEEFRTGVAGCKDKTAEKEFVRVAGFDFTNDEIQAARVEFQDVDLEKISGGVCCFGGCTTDMPCIPSPG